MIKFVFIIKFIIVITQVTLPNCKRSLNNLLCHRRAIQLTASAQNKQ